MAAVAAHRVVTLAERQAAQRETQLQYLAVQLLADLKTACCTAHALGRRQLTWGAVVPGVQVGKEEDMDDVLTALDRMITEDRTQGAGFAKVEWCRAQAPTQWVFEPARFGSHMQVRVYWGDADGDYFQAS
ncbi:unnamed protein product [Effrenium voratum]|nr:unnamed protein product [Effrenium voratum]|mmetsp:Transcript_38897/g.93012  ORF Transcript_38897/g.93012 Transcript_38897/m.93012 type:complete len:131 (-) Transcript_38897:66-458(-)